MVLIHDQANYRAAWVALLDRRPGLEVIVQAGSFSQARRRTTMVIFDLMVLDLVAALQALRLNQRGPSVGSPLDGRGQVVPNLNWKELDAEPCVMRIRRYF